MKILALLICATMAAILFRAASDFPDWSDPLAPANSYLSSYYLEHSLEDMEVPNVVSAVLADYRGFDTMLETTVVLIAAIAIIFLIRKSSYETDYLPQKNLTSPYHNLIIITVCRWLIPVMQIFAIYVVVHGHHSPGGGFQGGVILGATLILHAMTFGLPKTLKTFTEVRQRIAMYSGVLIFAGIGLACLVLGGNFLDYSALTAVIPIPESAMRSLAILGIETGVAVTVMTVMFSIYADLSSAGDMDEGL